MAGVAIRNVHKSFGPVKVIQGISMDIADGEFVVMVGPSGCGKSTLLRMVAGLESITSGEISIGERVVNELEPKDRDIAMVFQNYALYPHMSVYDNMAFGLKMRKFPKAEIAKRVQDVAEILGIHELLKRKPRQLSGGQRQRVAVGRAIVRHPQVFLFDEPLSNLDAKLRVQMRVELKRLHERLETTAIYVTHDQVEAMTLGSRVVVMRDGWVQQVGEPLEIYSRPANKFVAGFIGSPAMNFIPVTVSEANGALYVEATGLRVEADERSGVVPGVPGEDPRRRGAQVGAVEVLADAPPQRVDLRLAQAGLRTRRARLGALDAGGDAVLEQLPVVADLGGVRRDHRGDRLGHGGPPSSCWRCPAGGVTYRWPGHRAVR